MRPYECIWYGMVIAPLSKSYTVPLTSYCICTADDEWMPIQVSQEYTAVDDDTYHAHVYLVLPKLVAASPRFFFSSKRDVQARARNG
eukprot:4160983-Pleurochrysis_carterae.AAC.1